MPHHNTHGLRWRKQSLSAGRTRGIGHREVRAYARCLHGGFYRRDHFDGAPKHARASPRRVQNNTTHRCTRRGSPRRQSIACPRHTVPCTRTEPRDRVCGARRAVTRRRRRVVAAERRFDGGDDDDGVGSAETGRPRRNRCRGPTDPAAGAVRKIRPCKQQQQRLTGSAEAFVATGRRWPRLYHHTRSAAGRRPLVNALRPHGRHARLFRRGFRSGSTAVSFAPGGRYFSAVVVDPLRLSTGETGRRATEWARHTSRRARDDCERLACERRGRTAFIDFAAAEKRETANAGRFAETRLVTTNVVRLRGGGGDERCTRLCGTGLVAPRRAL